MNPEKFLNSLVNYEKIVGYDYNLKAYERFLAILGSPQKKLSNVILIGGTKGKGSTATIISSCLIANGYRVGLYTSPHLLRINERISVNDRAISNQDLLRNIAIIRPHLKKRQAARTYFEVLTTIAFLYFLEHKVDFSVLEVGLGGRLDATNVTKPLLSVITKIGYDHTNLLGNKLSAIAFEKAGIIKENGRLLTIHQKSSAEKVLKKVSRSRKAQLLFAEDQHQIRILSESLKGSQLKIKGEVGNLRVFLPLVGRHQVQNLSIALAVLNELKKLGFNIDLEAIKRGIATARVPGRFEIISKNPLVIYDCAHNQDSFEALAQNLRFLRNKNIYLIFGCSKAKDIKYCLRRVFPLAKEVLLVKANHPRAMEPVEIYQQAKRYQRKLLIADSVRSAIQYFMSIADHKKALLITGSFYLRKEVVI